MNSDDNFGDEAAMHHVIPDPAAWLVIAEDGFTMSFTREADADRWADRCKGKVHALHTDSAETGKP